MSLQEAIEAPEPAGLCLVSESPGAHERDMVSHQISKDAAKGWKLTKRRERLIGVGSEQSPQDRFAAFHAIFGAKIGNRIAGDQSLLHQEVEEAIDDPGTVQQRRPRPVHGTLAQPRFERIPAHLRGWTLSRHHNFLE